MGLAKSEVGKVRLLFLSRKLGLWCGYWTGVEGNGYLPVQ